MLDRLTIVSTDQILPFETASDARALKLAQEIDKEGRLRNPILALPLDDKYLMLDDAAIHSALVRLKITHVPIQLARLELLTVHPWQRVVENWHHRDLVGFCRLFPRQMRLLKNPSSPLFPRQAEVCFRDHTRYRLIFRSDSFLVRADLCIKFVDICSHGSAGFRAKLGYDASNPLGNFPQASAAIYPPFFSIDELGVLARRGIRLPQGLVRVDQPGRILGIDYSLAILKEQAPVKEKESFLRELIRMRMSSDRTVYYDGYVLILNS